MPGVAERDCLGVFQAPFMPERITGAIDLVHVDCPAFVLAWFASWVLLSAHFLPRVRPLFLTLIRRHHKKNIFMVA